MINTGIPKYDAILNDNTPISFSTLFRTLKQKGNLVYEYNPLRNYRVTKDNSFIYQNRLFTVKELLQELGYTTIEISGDESIPIEKAEDQQCLDYIQSIVVDGDWRRLGVPNNEEFPVFIEAGQLTDFNTDELKFDLNHPIDIIPQYSYDGSVNLIINDGTNQPRLINSRFSPIGRNQYEIVDRKGDNDTNIYDQGDQFDVDTSLYKRTTTIAKLQFTGITYSGNLPVGNYHFYFRYEDADGNQTDYIAESGLVSIFIGNDPYNIYSGFRNQNSYKGCTFLLTELDSSYQYVSVYYTRNTSDINENSTVQAYKINQKYLVNNANMCSVLITGFEDTTEITLEEINLNYQIVQDAFTQDVCQNILFLANVHKTDIPYTELQDISLRFLPGIHNEPYNIIERINKDYIVTDTDNYYNPQFIYNKTGYWPGEIYRLGIVYILADNTLSPVFNIRGGIIKSSDETNWSNPAFYTDSKERKYISFDEQTYLISGGTIPQENAKGVVQLDTVTNNIVGISIKLQTKEAIEMLQSLKIKGFFFVRQKRIPTTLCQAFTIGVDRQSHLPAIPVDKQYKVEQLLNKDREISHDFTTYDLESSYVDFAAICPEYDVNPAYFNTMFNGDTFKICKVRDCSLVEDIANKRHFYCDTLSDSDSIESTTRIIAVEDNVKLVGLEDKMFSARAGEAEEGFRYEYIGYENVTTNAGNITRGSYGPYLGLTGALSIPKSIIDIKIPNYSSVNMPEYFQIRYQDKSSYQAISDRYAVSELTEDLPCCYRGDCYICQFTHRVNRNFSDPTAPTNDKIVDPKCWKDHYKVSDGVVKTENFDEINLGDLNAKKMGMWITIQIRATRNLCIRALDDSNADEIALYGQPRAFYPYQPISTSGVYKIPEALCYNDGFSKGLSYRYNFEVPDVPYIKNEFTNRILYSDIHVNDAFTNGFRTFQGTHYRDYPKTYGSITRIIEFRGNLICVFEHGVALIAVNERAVAGEGAGGNVYINTSNVLPENPKIISDKYGSQWRESIIKTPLGIYGVDTIGKKIWRTDGETFECISDFRVQEFLNQNISLTERELTPIVGIRNVKTHYNSFKQDVMFTFYDNLYGFEEKVWNLCWNEFLQKFVTFYSWVPSYSENIYNQYFSFDRNTSKYIAKLGISNSENNFSDGITLDHNVFSDITEEFELSLSNRNLPSGTGITPVVTYSLERDNYGNYKNFSIITKTVVQDGEEVQKSYLKFNNNLTYKDYCSEFYVRTSDPDKDISERDKIYPSDDNYSLDLSIYKDDKGRRVWLQKDNQINNNKVVIYLNIKAHIETYIDKETGEISLKDAYASGYVNKESVDSGYYESTIALIPQYNIQFLTTDFWKHGQAGIIDITDKIYPTYWYGKQHPFEFEFVVAGDPDKHKIFNNLQIISNNAEPESFHYEIIGDCYNFAKDKKNMYIRQEATKHLYQYNGSDITYDHSYSDLESIHRPLKDSDGNEIPGYFDKSTLFPLYYSRQDTINDIEDYYHLKDGVTTKDFSALAGGEIVYYETLDEYRIWNHAKAVDMQSKGRLRGNMQYNEGKWCIQINPINVVYKNEPEWINLSGTSTSKIPVELGQSPIPSEVLLDDEGNPKNNIEVPEEFESGTGRGYVTWKWNESQNSEVKVKDKWMKVRIRYTGDKLAIINAIKTLYSISYS